MGNNFTIPDTANSFDNPRELVTSYPNFTPLGQAHRSVVVSHPNTSSFLDRHRDSQDSHSLETNSPIAHSFTDHEYERSTSTASGTRSAPRYHTRRKPHKQDEFDGPTQLLQPPSPRSIAGRDRQLPSLPVHLGLQEQDEVLTRLSAILSNCAYHFVAKYNFPIPLERDRSQIRTPADRDWTEWAYLLKRLATKRRIPARLLYENQIKQFVTTLDNSITVKDTVGSSSTDPARRQSHPAVARGASRDDRNVLQLISAGIQVARILMDALAMEQLDNLYTRTEGVIQTRRNQESVAMRVRGY